jgi:LPS export ABC transporter protein LptC
LSLFSIVASVFYFAGCKNDIEVVNALANEVTLPDQSGKNVEFQLTDSGKLKLIFKAPLAERYIDKEKEPFKEFPKGIEVLFYNEDEQLESKITAGYAKQWEEQMLWKATDSVVAQNVLTGERLDTEELFWDEKNKKIYANVFTKITNEEGIFYGEKGFEADQDLENYKLIGSSGSVKVKDEEIE